MLSPSAFHITDGKLCKYLLQHISDMNTMVVPLCFQAFYQASWALFLLGHAHHPTTNSASVCQSPRLHMPHVTCHMSHAKCHMSHLESSWHHSRFDQVTAYSTSNVHCICIVQTFSYFLMLGSTSHTHEAHCLFATLKCYARHLNVLMCCIDSPDQ